MRSKKVLINVITNVFSQIVVIVYGFIIPKIIITKYGSDVNGLISSITHFLGYISLLQSGFGPVIKSLLYKPIANKDKQEIAKILKASERFFKRIAIVFVVYVIALSLLYPIIVNQQFDFVFTSSLVIILSLSVFAEYYFGMTYRLFLQAKQKNYIVSIINTGGYILSLISVVILSILNADIHIIKLTTCIIFIIKPIVQNYYIKRKYNISLRNEDKDYKIKQKWDGLAQHIAAVINDNTDIVLLTIFRPLTEVSIYSVYALIIKAISTFIESFCTGIDSIFGDMIAKNEKSILRKKFNAYETVYLAIATILFSSSLVLITPFVSLYTKGATDVDYERCLFGILLVTGIYIRCIREIYNGITKAAGHFKQTRKGAWLECFVNIIVSLLLVNTMGIEGVAIGTIVAMIIRAIEFIYHSNKYIIDRSVWISFKKILMVITETIIIVTIATILPFRSNNSYMDWGINALMVFSVSCLVTITINLVFCNKEIKEINSLLKTFLKKMR